MRHEFAHRPDFAGQELWRRNLAKEYGHFANMWMYGSSPMLYGGRLYVNSIGDAPGAGTIQIGSASGYGAGEVYAKLDNLTIFPATQYVTSKPTIERAVDNLRAELEQQGHRLSGTGDTPTIPHLYEQHGDRFVEGELIHQL